MALNELDNLSVNEQLLYEILAKAELEGDLDEAQAELLLNLRKKIAGIESERSEPKDKLGFEFGDKNYPAPSKEMYGSSLQSVYAELFDPKRYEANENKEFAYYVNYIALHLLYNNQVNFNNAINHYVEHKGLKTDVADGLRHWLKDLLDNPKLFKMNDLENLRKYLPKANKSMVSVAKYLQDKSDDPIFSKKVIYFAYSNFKQAVFQTTVCNHSVFITAISLLEPVKVVLESVQMALNHDIPVEAEYLIALTELNLKAQHDYNQFISNCYTTPCTKPMVFDEQSYEEVVLGYEM